MRWLPFFCCLLLLSACKTQSPQASQEKIFGNSDDKGPTVNELVKPDQDKWLVGEVKEPQKAQIQQLFIFGDSLSDPGNLNKRTLGLYLPPKVFYRSRFSNGPIWSDYTAQALGWKIENYAVGGAETSTKGLIERIAIPSFLQQIQENKSELKKAAFAQSLVVVWIGPNNYFSKGVSVQDANQNPIDSKVNELVEEALEDIKEGLSTLYDLGFRQIVVGTMPELGGIIRNPKDKSKASDATFFSATAKHNSGLRELVAQLPKEKAGLQLILFQAYEINAKTTENAKNYGFQRLDAPCYIGSLTGQFDGEKRFCQDPSGYKFWEYVHPNSKMHCYYATQFLADLTTAQKIGGYDSNKAVAKCLKL